MLKTRDDEQKKIPFSLTHNERKGLVDQVVDGFRAAISSGYYREGDVLPSRKELADIFGVSVRVPRDAMAQLAAEGLVNPRKGLGSVVLKRGNTLWRGRVVLVWLSLDETTYYATTLVATVRRKVIRAGYLFSSVALPGGSSRDDVDLSILDSAFCQSADIVIALAVPEKVRRWLSRRGIRFVYIGNGICRLPGCLCSMSLEDGDAVGRFVDDCVSSGVRTVVQARCEVGNALSAERLREAGIEVEELVIVPKVRDLALFDGALKQAAFDLFLERFRHADSLPDVIYCSDDYIAFGAITALALSGVHAPEDVGLVVLANHGFVPVYDCALTRIEYDFISYGERLFDLVLKILAKEPVPPVVELQPVYIRGKTFPAIGRADPCVKIGTNGT